MSTNKNINNSELSNRELYIKTFFIPTQKKEGVVYMSEEEAVEIVKKISKIGSHLGFIGTNASQDQKKTEQRKHKYDVWIAKEVKRNSSILEKTTQLRLIIDWAAEAKSDLFSFTYEQALEEQKKWHQNRLAELKIHKIKIPSLDEDRIYFRFSDQKHFLYLLNEKDLKYEGQMMGHCVGAGHYNARVKKGLSIILSLRDEKNEPHVTIEINSNSRTVIQQYGKGNQEAVKKYRDLLKEFILFSSDFDGIENSEVLRLLNLYFIE